MTFIETYFMIKVYILMGIFTLLGIIGTIWLVWSFILPYKWKNWINKKVKE